MKRTGFTLHKVFIGSLVIFSVILFFHMPVCAEAGGLRVMTRNVYLGAEILPLVASETPEEFLAAAQKALEQAAANDFPERAEALAAEILLKNPHLVGLQEVYNFTVNGSNGPVPYRDYLADLMAALEAQGADYRVAAAVKNLDITIPLSDAMWVGVVDRDVILVREDVDTEVVDLAASGICEKSLDGCNYSVVASADTPLGPIVIERGVVAVDAVVEDLDVRFFNTHLEVRNVDPTNPLSPYIQAAQAFELITLLDLFPNPGDAPIIVAGDINSSPEHLPIGEILPPYLQLELAGYVDVWTLRPGNPWGFTCCQAENLLNPESNLTERVDVIFSSEPIVDRVKVNPVGNDTSDKTLSGLWPSDHAGVVARLEFSP